MEPSFPAGLPLHVRHSNVSFSLIPIHLNRSVTSQEPPDKNKCPTTGWSKYYTCGCPEPITSHTWVRGSRHLMYCYKKCLSSHNNVLAVIVEVFLPTQTAFSKSLPCHWTHQKLWMLSMAVGNVVIKLERMIGLAKETLRCFVLFIFHSYLYIR